MDNDSQAPMAAGVPVGCRPGGRRFRRRHAGQRGPAGGGVLIREDLVNFDADNPDWAVFPATPPSMLAPGTDPRVHWCLNPAPGCVRTVRDPVSGQAWDVDLATGQPTLTSVGNAANDVVRCGAGTPSTNATPSPDRDYTYPFTDQWHQARCDPATFLSAQRNDADAAVTNLFAMHNQMHDFAYHLGFTEATWNLQAGTPFTFTVTGAGFGSHRLSTVFQAGKAMDLRLDLARNLASSASGATVTGDGINISKINDDTEATDWASLDGVAGKQVTVDLAGDTPRTVASVNVSALLRPAITGDADPGTQNRFSALRSFAVLACDATVADCTTDAGYHRVFTSAPDAFPAAKFRPTAPQLNLRTFSFTPVQATHLRIQVLTSQCTGGPDYAGEQDADPATTTDCTTGSPFAQRVRISEFQAFGH
jgi:hypothetical protein